MAQPHSSAAAPIDLQLDKVSKRYWIPQDDAEAAPGWIGKLRHRFQGRKEFWAVKDLSFGVTRGQALGIIGHNGAGKSTILKLLSGITAPSLGEIRIQGRITALLEVGSGFHPELTGRENVFLSGSILGMRRKEIHAKLEQIIEFAEIRPFIDIPVKRYSSGMFVRLGFSIAAHLEPDILLLDEVLAVGDASFQKKCIDRVLQLKSLGMTIVFISHDLKAVEQLCERVVVLERGVMVHDGPTAESIRVYTSRGQFERTVREVKARRAEIMELAFFDDSGRRTTSFDTGQPMYAQVSYRVNEAIPNASVHIHFISSDLTWHCGIGTGQGLTLEPGNGTIELYCPQVCLRPDVYSVDLRIEQFGSSDPVDALLSCSFIQVGKGIAQRGLYYHPHTWKVR